MAIAAVAIALFACHSSQTDNNKKKQLDSTHSDVNADSNLRASHSDAGSKSWPADQLGKVISNVRCKADTNSSYAIYVPKCYDGTKALPLVVFFDPHASGTLPLAKYQQLAEKFKTVFAGSNNSKNGNSLEQNIHYANAVLTDVQQKLNIAAGLVYAAGFSGGSRVATGWAIQNPKITGAIGFGAGFPSLDKPISRTFPFIGIVGNQDFNLSELEELDHQMGQSHLVHQLLIFNGKHEWSPAYVFLKAMLWINLKAMNQHQLQLDSNTIAQYRTISDSTLKILHQEKRLPELLSALRERIEFLYGLTTAAESAQLETQITALKENPIVQKAQARKKEIKEMEKQLRDVFLNALASKDENWWRNEVKQNLDNASKFQADQLLMNKRILNYLSLACFLNANDMLTNKQLPEAMHYANIYGTVDPTNNEVPYLKAKIYNAQGNATQCQENLQKAIKMGFNEPTRFTNDFKAVLKKETFEALLSNINKQ